MNQHGFGEKADESLSRQFSLHNAWRQMPFVSGMGPYNFIMAVISGALEVFPDRIDSAEIEEALS